MSGRRRLWYSGHSKTHVAKVQVLCDRHGLIHAVSQTYVGSGHDKAVWNDEFHRLPVRCTVIADKAYAGGLGEGERLFRPIRRNVTAWRNDPEGSRSFNAALSKRRVRIEHVFARLKTWRIIHHFYPMRPESYATTVRAIADINNSQINSKLM
jgi:Transposase DDE domain.